MSKKDEITMTTLLVDRLRDRAHCNDWYLRQEAAARIDALLDAAEEVIGEREQVMTAAEAKLTLLIFDERPTSIGRENCTCGDQDNCDECMPLTDSLALLRSRAAA